MKQRFLVIAMFLGLVVAGSIAYAVVDSVVLGHVDGKLAHTALDQFTLLLTFGAILTVGSVVPVGAAVFVLGGLIVTHRSLFAGVSAATVLALFVSGAYVPVAEWVEPAMPRNALYAFAVAAILGAAAALLGLAACVARTRVAGA